MKVFVAGGSGVLGTRLVPQLVDRGHDVVATTSSPNRLIVLESLGARAVVMDGLDAGSVRRAVAEAAPDVIVNEMTAISPAHAGKVDIKHPDRWFAGTNLLRTKGTDNIIAAAQAAGVGHIVAQGYASWNGDPAGGPAQSEETTLNVMPGTASEVGLKALQHVENRILGVGGAVLRYGALYGPGATDDQVELIRKRQYPLVGRGDGYSSWIHLDDAASATVLALEQRVSGVFNVVDDEPARASEWLPYLAECAGARPPMRVPVWLARILAGEQAVVMMTKGRGFSNAKAKRELGWTLRYPSWRQGFRHELLEPSETAKAS